MQGAPKYAKIEILLRDSTQHGDGLLAGDTDFPSITKKEFNNCGMAISGDHLLVIETETKDEVVTHGMNPQTGEEVELEEPYTRKVPVSSQGHIFPLSEVVTYKTTNE